MLTCAVCSHENREGALFCDACGAALAEAPPALQRRKLATVLFCDLSGSTAMGERTDPETVRELMFQYFHAMRTAIERHGGTVEKFAGDAVMAVFGVPQAHEDDAVRACRAAVEMQRRLEELNVELERRFGTRLQARIGVNTGEVVAGDGSETFVTGDAVNVAARLEQAASPGEVLLGEQTYGLVGDAVDVEPMPPIDARGKTDPVPAYRLRSVASAAPPRRAAAPLVGREAELDRLEHACEQAIGERSSRLVTIVGEPGVGKSRLAAELEARLAGRARVYHGRCLSYGEGITFWPLAEIVREAAGIHDEDSAEEARARIEALVDGDVAARIAALVGLGGAVAPEEVDWAVRRLVTALAGERPLVLVIEDVHWAEETLLDLLLGLERLEAPVVLLTTARPDLLEARSDWPGVVRLGPLQEEAARVLLRELLGEEPHDELVTRAGGNPLFVQELAALVRQQGDLDAVPATLHALLTARLDRLPPTERDTLERASVEGEVFHRGAVAALLAPDARTDLHERLQHLADRELAFSAQARFVGEAAFRFRHILIRDAAYAGLVKRLRAQLHERFAHWLLNVVDERLGEYEDIIGYHLEQAYRYRVEIGGADDHAREIGRRASDHLASAGRRAAERSDARAAVRLLDRALEVVSAGQRSPELLLAAADARRVAGDVERAIAAYDQAKAAAREAGDRSCELRAMLGRAWLEAMTEAEPGTALVDAAERAIPELEAVGDDAGLAVAWQAIAHGHHFALAVARRQQAYERAVFHARRAGDEILEGELLLQMSAGFEFGPTPVEDAVRRCREILERPPNRSVEAGYSGTLGMLEAARGNVDEARRLLRRAQEVLDEVGNAFATVAFGIGATETELLLGNLEAAESQARRTFEYADELGISGWVVHLAGLLAEIVYRSGHIDEAERFADQCREGASPDDLIEQAQWRQVTAKVLAQRGQFAEAEPLARQAVELLSPTDALNAKAAARVALAEVLELASRRDEAATLREEAVRLYGEKGNSVGARAAAVR